MKIINNIRAKKQDRQTQKLFDDVTKSLHSDWEAQREAQRIISGIPNDEPLHPEWPIAKTYIALTAPIGTVGKGIAKGLGWIGEKMMPSALLKGVGQVFPKLAKATTALSPYADAGALSLWGVQGLREAKQAAQNGDVPGAIAGVSMAALPLMGIRPNLAQELTRTQKANEVARALNREVRKGSVPAQVKYYGPTMGKSYAAKTNPNLIDLDTWGRPEYDQLAKKYGYKDWREMILSDKGDYNQEYKALIKDQIKRIQSNPQYNGKTIVVSNASLLNPNSGIVFENIPTIPERTVMAQRNNTRHPWESIEHGEQWWDSLQAKGTPLKIDNRFVSEIEGNKVIEFTPKQNFVSTYHFKQGGIFKAQKGKALKLISKIKLPTHTNNFSGVENLSKEAIGFGGARPNLGLQAKQTEERSKELIKIFDEFAKKNSLEARREAFMQERFGKSWADLTELEQYWTDIRFRDKWK